MEHRRLGTELYSTARDVASSKLNILTSHFIEALRTAEDCIAELLMLLAVLQQVRIHNRADVWSWCGSGAKPFSVKAVKHLVLKNRLYDNWYRIVTRNIFHHHYNVPHQEHVSSKKSFLSLEALKLSVALIMNQFSYCLNFVLYVFF
ncbi:hypothetical protein M8C21_000200 [Ambrosia artemisiifolia]|uniref:Uncharacterized protein n=1 Tax=Ambrosia artemisiifolia TaxID=4212 RepID=A0AAD5D317_AMBAR|nr:hypothetical protein M8C21_000200 [Ambrosia artemisiifolia]